MSDRETKPSDQGATGVTGDSPPPAADVHEEPAPEWEAELDTYPLREPSEDPKWARRTVFAWVIFVIISIFLMALLTTLGYFYD